MSNWTEKRKGLIAAWSAEECTGSNQVIPAEAVEAAAREIESALQSGEGVYTIARAALEAAAPYLTERAYNAGHLDGMNGTPNVNHYGRDWLNNNKGEK